MAAPEPARVENRTSGPTRERLLAAARVVPRELGSASTPVAGIVALAGADHGTFYTYFDGKRNALALTEQPQPNVRRRGRALRRRQRQSPRNAIRARLTIFFRTYGEWSDIVACLG